MEKKNWKTRKTFRPVGLQTVVTLTPELFANNWTHFQLSQLGTWEEWGVLLESSE